MLVKIDHKTEYKFSGEIFLEPHTIRLTPREDPAQILLKTNIAITPEPAGMSKNIEQDGTLAHQAWFKGMTSHLTVVASHTILLKSKDPFDFIVHPESALKLPMKYPRDVVASIQDELVPLTDSKKVQGYAQEIGYEVNNETLPFLTTLAEKMYKEFEYEYREFGDPYRPSKTYHNQKGSCRDLAVLYMAICRSVGIASRFVSGYFIDEEHKHPPELHAWVEVYLPGGGWRGFDPTNGIAVAGNHIVLAASNDYSLTAPVAGTYRGDATSEVTAEVEFKKLKDTKEDDV